MPTTKVRPRAPAAPPALPRTRSWWAVALLSFAVAGYGIAYLVLGSRIFPPDLADSFNARPWGIFPHALLGSLGLILGPLQFHSRVQARTALHRRIGTFYVLIAVGVGLFGLYMSFYSFGGMITHFGFGLLGCALVISTLAAFSLIKRAQYRRHREWMLRSYALMFGAVTLRLWLPLLVVAHQGAFLPAYQWVAWLSWVPNLLFAEWFIRRTRSGPLYFGGSPLAG